MHVLAIKGTYISCSLNLNSSSYLIAGKKSYEEQPTCFSTHTCIHTLHALIKEQTTDATTDKNL